MQYEVHIEKEGPRQVAAVKFHTSVNQITNDISSGFEKLMIGLTQAGVAPSGSPMILYHDVIDEQSDGDVEICVPVDSAILDGVDVFSRELEGGLVATTTHKGPYQEVTPAYHSITQWISENGYEIVGAPREIYINDPTITAPEELLTQVEFPISKDTEQGQP